MLYDLDTSRARQRVRMAREELRRRQRRFDRCRDDDRARFLAEIRATEEELARARTALRLMQDRAERPAEAEPKTRRRRSASALDSDDTR
jgi:hypothetical protein